MTTNTYYYIGPNPTCDLVIFNHKNEILLIKRAANSPACAGQWALPGGFIDSNVIGNEKSIWKENKESPKEAAVRELKEETNLTLPDDIEITFIDIYEGNNRDPRDNDISWSKSHSFFTNISEDYFNSQNDTIRGSLETDDAKWFSLDSIDYENLAFDHKKIIQDAIKLKNNLSNEIKKHKLN